MDILVTIPSELVFVDYLYFFLSFGNLTGVKLDVYSFQNEHIKQILGSASWKPANCLVLRT